jgi:hypothetical protein
LIAVVKSIGSVALPKRRVPSAAIARVASYSRLVVSVASAYSRFDVSVARLVVRVSSAASALDFSVAIAVVFTPSAASARVVSAATASATMWTCASVASFVPLLVAAVVFAIVASSPGSAEKVFTPLIVCYSFNVT